MANTVNVTVTGQDKSGPAINSATAGLKNIGTVAAGILSANILQGAASRMTAFISSTVKAASNLGESANAVGKVFGAEADTVEKWGKDNAAAFGLSQRAFNELITPMGALLKNSGMAMKDVSGNTIELTKRAADMASVFNTDVGTALQAIQAGLRGESDPLEQFGVHLSAAAVDSEALAETGKSVASALTEQEKATARVNLIMKQTADTAGDFADTSDGLANSQRIATAEIENAQAEIGTAFLPVMAKAAQAVGTLADLFSKIPAPIQGTVAVVATLGAAFLLLAPKISAAKDIFKDLGVHLGDSESKMGKTAKAVGVLGAAFIGLQIVGAIADSFRDEFNPQMDAAEKGLLAFAQGANLSGEAARSFNEDTGLLGRSMSAVANSGFSQSMDEIFASVGVGAGALQDAKDKVAAFDKILADLVNSGHGKEAFDLMTKAANDSKTSVDNVKKVLPQYQAALEGAGHSAEDFARSNETATTSLKDLNDELASTDPIFAFMKAQHNVTAAQKAYNDAVKSGGKNSSEAKSRLEDLGQAAIALSSKAGAAGKAFDGSFTPAAKRMLHSAGLTKDEIRDLEAKLRAAKSAADRLNGTNSTVTITTRHVDTGAPGTHHDYAHGGITGAATGRLAGGTTMVGEHGPEIVDLPPGTNVHSNPDTMRMLSQSGGGQNVTVNLYVSGSILSERQLVKIIRDEFMNGGFRGALSAA